MAAGESVCDRREDRRTSEHDAPESKLFHVNRESKRTQASGRKQIANRVASFASKRIDATNTDGRSNTDADGEPQALRRKPIHRRRLNRLSKTSGASLVLVQENVTA